MKLIASVVLLLSLTLACAGAAPTATPDATLRADIDQLQDEMEDLRQETPQPTATPDTALKDEVNRLWGEIQDLRQDVAEVQGQRQQGLPATPAQDIIENICDRSPAMQRAILEALGLSLCSLATNDELFRIESLDLDSVRSIKEGDFSGLVNLSRLEMDIYDSCGQWDNIAFTASMLADLPSLGSFYLRLYREELRPGIASAANIADMVFLATQDGLRLEADERSSESNENRMEARYRDGNVSVQVYISADQALFPCRSAVAL